MYPPPIRVLLCGMFNLSAKHTRNEHGNSAVEYALMAAGIALGSIFMILTFTYTWEVVINGAFEHMGNESTPASSSPAP